MITIRGTRHAQLIRPNLILGAGREKYMRISPSMGGALKENQPSATFLGTELERRGRVGTVVGGNPVIDVAKPRHRANADPLDPLALSLGERIDIVIDQVVDVVALVLQTVAPPHAVNDPVVMELVGSGSGERQILPLKLDPCMAAGVKAVVAVKQRQLEGQIRRAVAGAGAGDIHPGRDAGKKRIQLIKVDAERRSLVEPLFGGRLIAVHVRFPGELIETSVPAIFDPRTISAAEQTKVALSPLILSIKPHHVVGELIIEVDAPTLIRSRNRQTTSRSILETRQRRRLRGRLLLQTHLLRLELRQLLLQRLDLLVHVLRL